MSTTDIAGYLYESLPHCAACIGELFTPPEPEWVNGAPRSTEAILNHVAPGWGIDRARPKSFTSHQFPQVLYPHEISGADACVLCGRPLGLSTHTEADRW